MRFNDEIVGEDRKSADTDLDCHHSLAAHMRTLPAFFLERHCSRKKYLQRLSSSTSSPNSSNPGKKTLSMCSKIL
jgi:hypothetical protein